jgi:hypothetical protein
MTKEEFFYYKYLLAVTVVSVFLIRILKLDESIVKIIEKVVEWIGIFACEVIFIVYVIIVTLVTRNQKLMLCSAYWFMMEFMNVNEERKEKARKWMDKEFGVHVFEDIAPEVNE